ncbi:MAG: winged helix-turn-helix domain-containing protein [Acidobacteria bacterium]|nr:winged helix-turn-helix domain-containing protein [Acidobacteriota bacterium]
MMLRFGPFTADRTSYRLLRDGRAVDLTPKLLDLLFHLVERPGVLVTKEELLDAVWPGANVTDNALAQAMSELREGLGDSAASPSFIRTIARRGYRFIAQVTEVAGEVEVPAMRPAASVVAPGGGDTPQALAVLDFVNVTGDADVEWLSAGVAETVTTDLSGLGCFRVIDRWRVVQAARRSGDAQVQSIAAAVGATLVVTGSVQRSGARVRITGRLVDVGTGETLADAKADGTLDDVFAMQDAIARAFVEELNLPVAAMPPRRGILETSSLDAYRAYMEGWLELESLDTAAVPAAINDFRRAIEADAGYAMAYTGLANAEFVVYEMTRGSAMPNTSALREGIGHARRAIQLDDQLAEAHATLAFLLVSALAFDEARAAARRAVAIEPDNWRHQYRLGHAHWGSSRLRAFDYVRRAYPQFAYAAFEGAMVLVARADLDAAAGVAREGVHEQDRQARVGNRFPAVGFHWLLGAVEAARGRSEAAILHFDRERLQADPARLYGPEYGAVALTARGYAELSIGEPERAVASFLEAQDLVNGYARAVAGHAAALDRLGRRGEADQVWRRADAICDGFLAAGHRPAALIAGACAAALRGDAPGAVSRLEALLADEPVSHLGWYLPVEPALASLRPLPAFQALLSRLAERAR